MMNFDIDFKACHTTNSSFLIYRNVGYLAFMSASLLKLESWVLYLFVLGLFHIIIKSLLSRGIVGSKFAGKGDSNPYKGAIG
ncbi:hypothetical protein ACET3Z_007000 [Daucus carota]